MARRRAVSYASRSNPSALVTGFRISHEAAEDVIESNIVVSPNLMIVSHNLSADMLEQVSIEGAKRAQDGMVLEL
ncbi:hypothetical protein [Microvirga sp. P5_D2]